MIKTLPLRAPKEDRPAGLPALKATAHLWLMAIGQSYSLAFARVGKNYPLTTMQLVLTVTATLLWVMAWISGQAGAGVPLIVMLALWILPAVVYLPESLATLRLRDLAETLGEPDAVWPDDRGEKPHQRLAPVFVTLTFLSFALIAFLWWGPGEKDLAFPFILAALVALLPSPVLPLVTGALRIGTERLLRQGVIVRSPQALMAASEIDLLLLDKTGTITTGERHAIAFIPLAGVSEDTLARAALLSSLRDPTPEGRSIIALARQQNLPIPTLPEASFIIPFTEDTRLSGIDLPQEKIRKGSADAVLRWLSQDASAETARHVSQIARTGGTPLLIAQDGALLGIVHLEDPIKTGIQLRIALLERLGVRALMITGDNPETAATIAGRVGLAAFLAEATPETKRELIRLEHAKGHKVAMCGDGSNDIPALTTADLALVLSNSDPAALKIAGMVDRDNSPNKLIEIILSSRQVRAARHAARLFQRGADAMRFVLLGALLYGFAMPGWLPGIQGGAPEAAAATIAALLVKAAPSIAAMPLIFGAVRPPRRRVTRDWRRLPWRFALFGAATTSFVLLVLERLLTAILA